MFFFFFFLSFFLHTFFVLVASDNANNLQVGRVAHAECPTATEIDQWTPMYLFILSECSKDNSFWRPYWDILPEVVLTPVSYSDVHMEELKGSNLFEGVFQIRSKLETLFKALFPTLTEKHPSEFLSSLFVIPH
jgi:hypothetical protein